MTKEQEKTLVQKYNSIGLLVTEIEDTYRGKDWNKYLVNGWTIWFCSKGWAKAKLANEHYQDHTYHASLEKAFLSAHTTKP